MTGLNMSHKSGSSKVAFIKKENSCGQKPFNINTV